MMRDPFYQAIVRQLEDGVDPELFERCAADILGNEWPTLVPVRGGGDAGMDGAIGQQGEMPMPLVCTTGTDVIGNLTRSLDSYVAHGGLSRQVISATSQALTPTRRRNLENRASDKGFTLVNIYDQAAFADRLYRNPRWCRELLNIPGDPPAISAVPLSSRPLSGIPLVGRDDALTWLQTTAGDLLIYGQPGIGKTSILLELLKAKDGGFLVDDDQGRILDAIREQQPGVIIVDDAHLAPDRLTMLDRLRRETGLAFAIVATAWPGSAEQIRTRMGIPIASVREIGLLTRDEIVQVVRESGVLGPDPLVAEIVNQARGRPGLASTLARLCLRGDVASVVLGDTLANDVRHSLSPMMSEADLRSMACFALGGNAGMRTSIVARVLGIPLPQLATAIATLSHAGFIEEVRGDRDASHAIVPEVLRFALVRDVFYNGPGRLDPTTLIESANSLHTVARTLVGAVSRGARIAQEDLLDVLERAESPTAWQDYAWLGTLQARQMLEQHPEWAALNAKPLLEHIPGLAAETL